MKLALCSGAIAALVCAAAGPALAAAAKPAPVADRPAALKTLLDCRKVTDPQQRLSCYDTAADSLDTAATKGDVVVVDREQIRSMKRQTFGLTLPSVSQFLDKGRKEEIDDRIELTLTGVQMGGDGHTIFTFDDGSVWRQLDTSDSGLERKTGQKATINRAMMGSFFLTVGKIPGVKVQRQR